jgi:site-specific recombinase XerD
VFPHTYAGLDNGPWYEPCVEEAGLTDYTWHNSGHTFCSWMALKGATLKEIQEAAGHKSITMSARYAHLASSHVASVVARLDD